MRNKLIVFIAAAIMTGCLSGSEVVSTDVSPLGWTRPAKLTFTNRDTLAVRELALVFRTEGAVWAGAGASTGVCDYTIEAVSPDGAMVRDEISVALAGKTGSSAREIRVPFRSGVTFSQSGNYVFTITPARKIRGVQNVAMDFN